MTSENINIILIIENKIQAEFIEMIFEDNPEYTFQKLFNGLEAYNLLKDNFERLAPSVIIMSYQLPEMDGLKIMNSLKENGLNYAFIFLTSDKTVERALDAMKAGAIDFLPKSENLQVHLPDMVQKVYNFQKEKLEQARIKEELDENRRQLEKLSIVARETDNGVIIYNSNGKLEWMNEAYLKITGYNQTELIDTIGENIFDSIASDTFNYESLNNKDSLKTKTITSQIKNKNNEDIWLQTNISVVYDENGTLTKLIRVDSDITDMKLAEMEILRQQEKIEHSIVYAKRIQDALMFKQKLDANNVFSDFMLFLRPKDIVSGDFYWSNQVDDKIIIAAADCTGHGVPGAFMSMLGITSLNVITKQLIIEGKEKLTSGSMLDMLKESVIKALSQKGLAGEAQDGMDIALCIFDENSRTVQFSGAHNPLFIIRNNELIIIKSDKMPIGIHRKVNNAFTAHNIDLEPDDVLYMFSDGYIDQFNNENKKFLSKNFKELLLNIYTKPMDEQYKILSNTIDNWKGDCPQTDDMLIIGIKIK